MKKKKTSEKIVGYMDEGFSVEYKWNSEEEPPTSVNFLAYKMETICADSFTPGVKPVIDGFIKRDGGSEIKMQSHSCGLQELEQMFSCLRCLRKICDFADSILYPETHQNIDNVYRIQGGE